MQTGKSMARILEDNVQYIMSPKIRYAPEIGTYVSYDLAAYDCFKHDMVSIIRDVTSDRKTALHIVEKFNRYQLSPIHLIDIIQDML